MSPYLAATELAAVLPAHVSIGTNTLPLSLGEVASIISRVSGALDAAAAQAGYTVPVDPTAAPAAYGQMQEYTLDGAACRTLRTIFPNLGAAADRSSLASDYCDSYQAALTMLRTGQLVLIDAPESPSETIRTLPRSFETSNPADLRGGATPIISRTWAP